MHGISQLLTVLAHKVSGYKLTALTKIHLYSEYLRCKQENESETRQMTSLHRTNLPSLNSINHKLQRHSLALFIVKNHLKSKSFKIMSKYFEEWKFVTKMFEWRMD